ncbi:hypothetical protein NQZ68_014470 [Dissostichus eleginoides]|nr:hypothetical protein NQZ68_014470 [Dissostichus eleginoides]
MYWPALAHSAGPVAVQQRTVTLGGQGSATLTPHLTRAHIFRRPFVLDPCPSIPGLPFKGLQRGGACAERGGRCYVSDLPLHEIGFGDIRIKRSGAQPLPRPSSPSQL